MVDSNEQLRQNQDRASRDGSMSPIEHGRPRVLREEAEALDDQGTTQEEALELMQILHEDVFGSDDEKLALALGRTPEEVRAWLSGKETIDADLLMKARALIMERRETTADSD